MKSNLKRWELERQKKIHQSKIKNVKPTLKTQHSTHLSSPPQMSFEPVQSSSLFKLLKSYNLQQYASKLDDMGFSSDISVLLSLSEEQLEDLFGMIKLLPGHKSRFLNMLTLLRSLQCRPVEKQEYKVDDSIEEQLQLQHELEAAQERIRELSMQIERQKEQSESPVIVSKKPDNDDLKGPLPEIEKAKKEVGVSYDSSKLRSTLAHIDIEEMCFCLSKAIRSMILSAQSLTVEHARSRGSLLSNFSSSLGQSLEYSVDSQDLNTDRSMFYATFNDPEVTEAPDETEIYNFCKNVIIRGQMEKECSIICLVYVQKLADKTAIHLNRFNWKRLVFITLVLANKVWDDESFENPNFAQAFTLFSLREIALFEMTLLGMIDYDVSVKNSEYAKQYFTLRTYSEERNRSFPLKPLEVETVRRLQNNANKAEQYLRDAHNEALFKTL